MKKENTIKITSNAELISLTILEKLEIKDFREFKQGQRIIYHTLQYLVKYGYLHKTDLD